MNDILIVIKEELPVRMKFYYERGTISMNDILL